MLMIEATSGAFNASLNGVMNSARLACMRVVALVSWAITTEIPIELPMLRKSVRTAVPSVRRWAGRVAKATVLNGTKTSPRPKPCIRLAMMIDSDEVWSVNPTI